MKRTITAIVTGAVLALGLTACANEPSEAPKVTTSPEAEVSESSVDATSPESREAADEAEDGAAIETSFKVGDTARVGDWEITVSKVTRPTTKQVKAWNEFNDKAKNQYVVANYTAKYVGTERTADVTTDLTWKFGGSNAQVYDQAFIVTSSDDEDAPTEARPGGRLKLDVAFDVPVKAITGGVVTVEGYDDHFDKKYADFSF